MTFCFTTEDCRCDSSKRMALIRNCCSTGMRELKKSRGCDHTSAKVEEVARTRFPVVVRPGAVKKPRPVAWSACFGEPPFKVLGLYAAVFNGM